MVVIARAGWAIEARLVFEGTQRAEWATVVFIHGAGGTPAQFAKLGAALGERVNVAAFVYDDTARLAPSAEVLRGELVAVRGAVVVVAHSLGALLPLYLGATDQGGQLRCLAAVYVNPLIGGSHYADDIKALWWLRPLKPFIQRTFFRASVRDLAPENEFEQKIFGRDSAVSSFREHTVVIFTEKAGEEPDIKPERVPRFFGRTREELLARVGKVVNATPTGHNAPLLHPEITQPIVSGFLDAPPCRRAPTPHSPYGLQLH